MSSELERLLKQAGERLPGPDADVTRRARETARSARTRRRSWRSRRTRAVLVIALTLAVTAALGIGLGLLIAPRGTAAGPGGLGFVAESGWTVLQSGADATETRPALAIASNLTLDPRDDARGIRDSSGLPYSTLLTLPPRGAVIVATFTVPADQPATGERFPARSLPLRLRDATPFVQNGVQIRPRRPLGEYELRARVDGRNIELHFYFGTAEPSEALVTAAQRQLDRLVVQPARSDSAPEQRALPLRGEATSGAVASSTRVIDRTLLCTLGFGAGVKHIDVSAQTGFRKDEMFEWQAQATIATPGDLIPRRTQNYLPQLAAVTAGWPPKLPLTSNGFGFRAKQCKSSRMAVPLSKRGLAGGVASQFGDERRCLPGSPVLIRARAKFESPTPLRLIGKKKDFYSAIGHVEFGQIAARTTKGKPIVYADVSESGRARLFTARSCS